MNNNFAEVEQRVRRYWYIDGFGELVGGGGMCLILGIFFAAGEYFGADSFFGGLLQAGLLVVVIGGVLLTRLLINAAKQRVTYPRTGYVECVQPQRSAIAVVLSVVVGIAMALTFVFIVKQFNQIDGMVAISGTVMGVVLLAKQVWTIPVKRFYILSLAALAYGVLLANSGLPHGYNLGLFYGLMSLSFVISGGLTLKKYLDENPLQSDLQYDQ